MLVRRSGVEDWIAVVGIGVEVGEVGIAACLASVIDLPSSCRDLGCWSVCDIGGERNE